MTIARKLLLRHGRLVLTLVVNTTLWFLLLVLLLLGLLLPGAVLGWDRGGGPQFFSV